MTRTATGPMLDILNALEPAAKTAWEAEEVNLREAISLSQAITDRRLVDLQSALRVAAIDGNAVSIAGLDPAVQAALPSVLTNRNDPLTVPE